MLESTEDRILDAALTAYQLHAKVTDNATYCDHWQEAEAAVKACIFHLIGEGQCVLKMPGLDGPQTLIAGDLVVFPHGAAHHLSGDGYTTMLCGQFDFIIGPKNPILDALPDCVIVRASEAGTAFQRIAQIMCEEARSSSFGSRAVLDKLADSLFVMTVRHHLSTTTHRRGLLAALADPKLRRALSVMHLNPGQDWTVAELATEACMSRTAFSELFSAVLGTSPINYLTQWRMMEALKLVQDSSLSMLAIAEKFGYQTEAAFRRSFKRIHGHGPGHFRRAK
ncbi:AraC family transcriptional regulator [Stenotrophobium rhamnosiphilum]|uniref:AraC family transcriptional regulator n=1 Tax=Stenotrophobium rhamnosiphilum TaxID=2029166 RepID=A0A2T5MBJ2_9GAMM|nr:AraC family transcriptional regulator [Stenotrophobium rhamnosiphilum]PTU29125.1 AraC family transcriptional regulator [Stenotrophobium rhamnosiphilum]